MIVGFVMKEEGTSAGRGFAVMQRALGLNLVHISGSNNAGVQLAPYLHMYRCSQRPNSQT
jgi:hypothetical protein